MKKKRLRKKCRKLSLGLEGHAALVKKLGGKSELSFVIFDIPEDEDGVELRVQDPEGSYLAAYYHVRALGYESKKQLIFYMTKFLEFKKLRYLGKVNCEQSL
jgi:hypothetical protein